ncbi:hypothetical protein CTI12_AA389240 [Artemisia annua]|uniref:Uncharacterized protein n=1 Tax=Artemisia annua TaxID=35608 RepID=A0A2U1MEE7_ARTAN|nr:hypothetical protein CTI12_AA389240 [Artemisia annua]
MDVDPADGVATDIGPTSTVPEPSTAAPSGEDPPIFMYEEHLRMIGDYTVEMMNDGMQEFYIPFHGPKERLSSRGGMSVVGSPGFSSGANAIGGSIPGILPTSVTISNRNSIYGVGVSPILGNPGSRIKSSAGNIGGGSSMGRSMSSEGGL